MGPGKSWIFVSKRVGTVGTRFQVGIQLINVGMCGLMNKAISA